MGSACAAAKATAAPAAAAAAPCRRSCRLLLPPPLLAHLPAGLLKSPFPPLVVALPLPMLPDWSPEPPNGTAQAVLAPNVAVHATPGRTLGPPLPRVPQAEACSAACRSTDFCSWFEYCPAPVRAAAAAAGFVSRRCHRLAADCVQTSKRRACSTPFHVCRREAAPAPVLGRCASKTAPCWPPPAARSSQRCTPPAGRCRRSQVGLGGARWAEWGGRVLLLACPYARCLARPAGPTRCPAIPPAAPLPALPRPVPAGFPARAVPVPITGFAEDAGWGVRGADFACPGSLVEGACALASALDAAVLCVDFPSCRALTVYHNGGRGWSSSSCHGGEAGPMGQQARTHQRQSPGAR